MKINLTLVMALCSWSVWANNITIGNVSIAAENTSLKYKMIQLDVSWQNSWRTYNYESNYDAAWIFIKYRKINDLEWKHASLNYVDGKGLSDGHIPAANSELNTPQDGKGVFLFRANTAPNNFIGDVNYNGFQLRWNYGADGVADTDLIEISVYAIEMVFVPEGGFYAGDGFPATSSADYTFQNGASSKPFYIESEAQMTIGGDKHGQLSRPGTRINTNEDDFNQNVEQLLPAAFPKGYKSFYCMKYEISQGQYAEFLKSLTAGQASNRYSYGVSFGKNRNTIDSLFSVSTPDRACNFLSWSDGIAYADWAGLRPMTELEYEKACRGPLYPVAGEYAWGSTVIRQLQTISQDGTSAETDGDAPRANCHFSQGSGFLTTTNPLYGPMRVGWTAGGSRESSGDTYYGIADMSGNLEEAPIPTGTVAGRNFQGTNGDGYLSQTGEATNSDWMGIAYLKYRGGSLFGEPTEDLEGKLNRLRVSKRRVYSSGSGRAPYIGFRCVRSLN
jgi:formylglycine-generating enzyme required for sulfatase activity